MSHDAIDQTLRNEPEIAPSADFPWRVMRSVRQEADRKAALPFPWKRLAAGLVVSAGLTVAGVLLGDPAPVAAPAGPPVPLATNLAWLTATLAATAGLAWWSMRFAGR